MKVLTVKKLLGGGRILCQDMLGREYPMSSNLSLKTGDTVMSVSGVIIKKIQSPTPPVYTV